MTTLARESSFPAARAGAAAVRLAGAVRSAARTVASGLPDAIERIARRGQLGADHERSIARATGARI